MQSVLLYTMLSAGSTGPAFVAMRKQIGLAARAPKGALIIVQTVAGILDEQKSGDKRARLNNAV